ncbi:MAG: hypothetical protein K2H46_10610 [Muribaculaceae bacterium]|nr:hypothetical protein [Muribaculaceae bacterium]
MKLTLRLIENLQRLLQEESIPYSALPQSLAESLAKEGLLSIAYHGTRRRVMARNTEALAGALPRYNEALKDLDAAVRLLTEDNSRAAQAALSGNSKTSSKRAMPGFLVNSYKRIDCMICGQPFNMEPAEGSAIYIANWQTFMPPVSTLIIGIENTENFLRIREQKNLFEDCLKKGESEILFVSRYAFSSDLVDWLASIPNRYLHFGDFDLAGIAIFLNEFKPYVEERGSFLIPSDIECRLKNGSRKRYDDHYQKFSNLTTTDKEINHLISLIHKYRRTYDQEGYIIKPSSILGSIH